MNEDAGAMEKITNKRPRRVRRIIIAAAAATVLLAAALIVGFVVVPALTAGSRAAELNAIEPLLYTEDGEVYMASGGCIVQLKDAKTVQNESGSSLNGEFCADKAWLFYIANHDKATGEGGLMRAASNGLEEPELVAQGVCDAKVSGDGKRVLYTSGASADKLYALDMAWNESRLLAQGVSWYTLSANGRRALYVCGDQNTGELYSWEFAGDPEFISGGVCSEYSNGARLGHSFDHNCGFSPNAANIYYIVKTAKSGRDEYTLYVKVCRCEAEEVAQRGDNSFLSGVMNGGGPLGDNGQMLYFSRGSILLPSLYLYSPGGGTEHFAGSCMIWTVFNDGSFLFRSDDSLYYKAPGQKEQRLSKHNYLFPLFGSSFFVPLDAEKRFFLMEADTDLNEGMPEKVTLFEQKIGSEKTELFDIDTDMLPVTFARGLKRLAYKSDGVLYMVEKENEKWSRPKMISDTGFVEIHLYENVFDTAGEYMYYRQRESEGAKVCDLYRYTIKRRKSELLIRDVREFYLIEDIPYAITANGRLFRPDTGEQLTQGVQKVESADGGVHIFTETDILYYGKDSDKPVTLCEGADVISADGIKYLPPLTGEVAAALTELCDDAQRCIDVLKAGGKVPFGQYQAKADALKARRDVSAELDGILNKFSSAFGQAGMWDASKKLSPEYKILGDDTTIEDLKEAIKECREYLGTEGDI